MLAVGAWCVWARRPPGEAVTRFDGSIGCDSPLGVLIGLAALLCGFGAVLAGLAAVLSWRLRRDDGRPLGVAVSLGCVRAQRAWRCSRRAVVGGRCRAGRVLRLRSTPADYRRSTPKRRDSPPRAALRASASRSSRRPGQPVGVPLDHANRWDRSRPIARDWVASARW
jgi:hypothetical protein